MRISDWSSDVCSSDLLQPTIDHLQSQHIRQLFLIVDNGVVLEPPRPQPAKAERRGNARFDQYRAGGQGAVRLAEIRNRLRLALALPVGEILSDILLEHLGIAIACD